MSLIGSVRYRRFLCIIKNKIICINHYQGECYLLYFNLTGGFTYGSLFNGGNEIEGETRETNSMVWTTIHGNNDVIIRTSPITFLSLHKLNSYGTG